MAGSIAIQVWNSLLSVGKIAIRSRIVPSFSSPDKRVIIIGNGPSAQAQLDAWSAQGQSPLPLMAVNMMARSPYFEALKPAYYLLADGAFFNFNAETFENAALHPHCQRHEGYQQTQQLINETWQALLQTEHAITLFIPQLYRKSWIIQQAKLCSNLHIAVYNYTVTRGFEWFENRLYTMGLGSPQSQNVINSCIFQAINAGFHELYLIGVDNNFHRNIKVRNDNQVVVVDDHFYEVGQKETPLKHDDALNTPVRMHEFFGNLHKAFWAHHRLAKYAAYRRVKVYNSTPDSFIDAYERRSIG
jgi:hypothetical protein